jgi:hypothetical protein
MLRLLSTSSHLPEARVAPISAPPCVCDEARNRDDPEYPAPRRHDVQQLRRDDRADPEAEQCEAALLQTLIEAPPLG